MSIESAISKINQELISTFAELDSWFDCDEQFLYKKFSEDEWSAAETLEHVMLTNHYLLVLIEKASVKAQKLSKNQRVVGNTLYNYTLDVPRLEEISEPEAFHWQRPDHMRPTGTKPLDEVRRGLRDQLYRCLCELDTLANGEGVLVHTQMSVNDIGRLDVYQYIYFLALHARRHVKQLLKRAPSIAVDWLI